MNKFISSLRGGLLARRGNPFCYCGLLRYARNDVFLLMFTLVVLAFPAAAETGLETFVVVKTQEGKSYRYEVELAVTEREQAKGLMFRNDLAENAGMLFLFPYSRERSFWMKNTLVPLDIIFIKENGVIHHIGENTVPLDLTSVRSHGPVKAVLEVNAGQTAARGIKPGNIVHHSIFGNVLAE